MIKIEEINNLEKLAGQLEGYYKELALLAKKSPNDGVNEFKLKFINITLENCNKLLGKDYKPFGTFENFNLDDVPSNSDVAFIISQYMQALEKLRADNIYFDRGAWYYRIKNSDVKIRTAMPAKLKKG